MCLNDEDIENCLREINIKLSCLIDLKLNVE